MTDRKCTSGFGSEVYKQQMSDYKLSADENQSMSLRDFTHINHLYTKKSGDQLCQCIIEALYDLTSLLQLIDLLQETRITPFFNGITVLVADFYNWLRDVQWFKHN